MELLRQAAAATAAAQASSDEKAAQTAADHLDAVLKVGHPTFYCFLNGARHISLFEQPRALCFTSVSAGTCFYLCPLRRCILLSSGGAGPEQHRLRDGLGSDPYLFARNKKSCELAFWRMNQAITTPTIIAGCAGPERHRSARWPRLGAGRQPGPWLPLIYITTCKFVGGAGPE